MKSRRSEWAHTSAGHNGIGSFDISADDTDIDLMKLSCYADLKTVTVDKDNPTYSSEKGVLYSKDGRTLLFYPRGREDQLFYVPGTVTDIGEGAFAGAEHLMGVMIPQSVRSIGAKAFIGAERLRSVNIPDAVERIEYATFFGCTALSEVTFGMHPHLKDIMAKAFSLCESLAFLYIPSVMHIGAQAFDGCTSLRYLMFNVRQVIEPHAFRETHIMLPDRLQSRRAELFGLTVTDEKVEDDRDDDEPSEPRTH